jgi:TetR/AcrR family transcriptional regulator, transcriptional repressor for nem operon
MDSRKTIVMTAYKLFLQKSYKEVTMKEIADDVGMTKGAFYHYFKSKEEVFTEIINEYFLSHLSSAKFESFSKDSLFQFINDYLNHTGESKQNLTLPPKKNNNAEIDINPFSLIFEASRIIPGFRQKMDRLYIDELNAWQKIIKRAKEKNEIHSEMTDGQIAKLFIYSNDGCGLYFISKNKPIAAVKKELSPIWNGLYTMLSK